MKKEELFELFSDVDENYVAEARKMRSHKAWIKWASIAACFCLVILAVAKIYPQSESSAPSTPMMPSVSTPSTPGDMAPNLIVNGRRYFISPYLAVSKVLPEGFEFVGKVDVGGFEDCAYYVNPDIPEWVYVYQEVRTDGTVDEHNVLNQTEPHMAYARYVDERLRGKDLLCYEGQLYISMWSEVHWGENPEVNSNLHDKIYEQYGIRLKDGEVPQGFESVGVSQFSGKDTIPRGDLVSNQGELEVMINPKDDRLVLVETEWYTAVYENGTVPIHGYDVYIFYEGELK